MVKDQLHYIYRGEFSTKISDMLLTLAEANLEKTGESSKVKKRVYFIMVECLQNITRHQEARDKSISDIPGIFVVQKKKDDYFITTANYIANRNINPLKAKLDKINSMNKEELKAYSTDVLTMGEVSDKGGAGLGLIEMARKSGNKIGFDFKGINQDASYFYMQTKVPSVTDGDVDTHAVPIDNSGLMDVITFHELISGKNVKLIYQGEFSQENVISILKMTEQNFDAAQDGIPLKKIFAISVEMLQNIFKHADYREETVDKSGVFIVAQDKNNFIISTGNLVLNDKLEKVKQSIDDINKMSDDELDATYSRVLMQETLPTKKSTGLGFIDLRLKSGNPLSYLVDAVDGRFSFFSLQISFSVN